MNGTALVVSMLRTAARVLTCPYNHSYIDFVCSPATWRLSVLTCHVASQRRLKPMEGRAGKP